MLGDFSHTQEFVGYLQAPSGLEKSAPLDTYVYDERLIWGENVHKKDGIERRSPSRLLWEEFLHPTGSVNLYALKRLRQELQSMLNQAFFVYCGQEAGPEQTDCTQSLGGALHKEWLREEKFALAATQALSLVDQAQAMAPVVFFGKRTSLNSKRAQLFLQPLFMALAIREGLKSEWEEREQSFLLIPKRIINTISALRIGDGPEAMNLKAPMGLKRKLLCSAPDHQPHVEQAACAGVNSESLKALGYDVSLLDPYDSGLWRAPRTPINEYDTSNYNGTLPHSVAPEVYDKIRGLEDSSQLMDAVYEKPHYGGFTPKMRININGVRFKAKVMAPTPFPEDGMSLGEVVSFFRHQSSEVRTEFVANSLAAAIGFTVNPTFYKRRMRLFFKTDGFSLKASPQHNLDAFYRARDRVLSALTVNHKKYTLHRRGLGLSWDYGNTFQDVQQDAATGRYFVMLKSVSLEMRSTDRAPLRFGHFHAYTLGRHLKREFRARMLFYMWLSDMDTKDANSSIGLLPTAQGLKLTYSLDDMGSVLGSIFGKNKPNFFSPNLVKWDPKAKQLVFPPWQPVYKTPILRAVNINDVKWFTRLIAWLTPEQMMRAFETANYPKVVADIFVQKLLRRRDQLVNSLGLEGEVVKRWGKSITLSSSTSSMPEDPTLYRSKFCEECFSTKGQLIRLPHGARGQDEDWGMSLSEFSEDSTQQKVVSRGKRLLINAAARTIGRQINRLTLGVPFKIKSIEGELGFKVPTRYVVRNPFGSADKPFWIVDIFRLIKSASRGIAWKTLDIRPSQAKVWGRKPGQGGTAMEVMEFVKVRAVGPQEGAYSIKDVLKVYNPIKNLRVHVGKLKKHFINQLQPGDFLISSHYLLFHMHYRMGTYQWVPSFEVNFIPVVTKVNRVGVYCKSPKELLMSWSDVKHARLFAGVQFDAIFERNYLYRQRAEKNLNHTKVYAFNPQKPEQKQFVLDYINRSTPEGIPQRFALQQAQIRTTLREFLLSLWGFKTRIRVHEHRRLRLKDSEENLLKDFASSARGLVRRGFSFKKIHYERGKEVTALVDAKHKAAVVRVNLFAKKTLSNRKDFARLLKKFKGYIPKQIISFDSQGVNYYLGTLSLQGKVLFAQKALKSVFSKSPQELCRMYVHIWSEWSGVKVPQREAFCGHYMGQVLRALEAARAPERARYMAFLRSRELLLSLHQFWGDWFKARQSFNAFMQFSNTDAGYPRLRRLTASLAALFESGAHSAGLRHFLLLRASPPDAVYRELYITNNGNAFPGQVWTLKLPKHLRGSGELKLHALEHFNAWDFPSQSHWSMGPAFSALQPFLLDGFWKVFLSSSQVGHDVLRSFFRRTRLER